MIDLSRPQPDYAADADAGPTTEWSIPRQIADKWAYGGHRTRFEVDRDLERLRKRCEADHAAMIHDWTFGPPAL
jgi:hypothetical protein